MVFKLKSSDFHRSFGKTFYKGETWRLNWPFRSFPKNLALVGSVSLFRRKNDNNLPVSTRPNSLASYSPRWCFGRVGSSSSWGSSEFLYSSPSSRFLFWMSGSAAILNFTIFGIIFFFPFQALSVWTESTRRPGKEGKEGKGNFLNRRKKVKKGDRKISKRGKVCCFRVRSLSVRRPLSINRRDVVRKLNVEWPCANSDHS